MALKNWTLGGLAAGLALVAGIYAGAEKLDFELDAPAWRSDVRDAYQALADMDERAETRRLQIAAEAAAERDQLAEKIGKVAGYSLPELLAQRRIELAGCEAKMRKLREAGQSVPDELRLLCNAYRAQIKDLEALVPEAQQ